MSEEHTAPRRSLGDALAALMGAELMFGGEEMRQAMAQAGVKEPSNADAVGYALLAKACAGDSNAMRMVRDLCAASGGESVPAASAPDLSALSDEELRRMVAAAEAGE